MSFPHGDIILPLFTIKEPTPGDGYMIVARDLLQGVEALSLLPNVPPRNCAFIAGFALECALKAFLWHKGKEKEIRYQKVQHNLKTLWEMAYNEGLSILKVPPNWVTVLSSGHEPFYYRYQVGKNQNIVHGGQTPDLIPMAAELKQLIEKVGLAIQ